MTNKKVHNCTYCSETDPLKFYSTRKTVCKKCLPQHTKLSIEEKRRQFLKPYKCKVCETTDTELFHTYCKNKCKEHYNGIKYKKGPKINIIKRTAQSPRTIITTSLDPHSVQDKSL